MDVKPAAWWKKLHKTLNDPALIQSLSKEAHDEEDQQILKVLGILQMWIYHFGEESLGDAWSPLLAQVADCKEASVELVDYLI